MTDANDAIPTPAIPLAEVKKHIDSHGAESPCEACGKTMWLVFSGANLRGVSLQVIDDTGFQSPRQTLPLMPLMCQNCGCMRFFAIGSMAPDAFTGEVKDV